MKNILVIRFSSLGDIVLTTGVIKYVYENIGENVQIDFLTSSHFAGILQDFPYIRNVYCINKGDSLVKLNEVISTMPEYDYIFDLHDNIRSFFTRFISSNKCYVYDKNALARRLFVKYRLCRSKLKDHTVIKYFKPFMKAFNLKMPTLEDLRPYLPLVNEKNNINAKKHIVIHPFASKKTKQWPFFAELASILIDDGVTVTVIGDGEIDLPPQVINKTGKISLSALADYISRANVFITTDSGPLHIATALRIPTVAIFGSTTKELGFYPDFKGVKVVEYLKLKCRPCHIHGQNSCPKKHFKCMMDIGVEEIRYHINNMLENSSNNQV